MPAFVAHAGVALAVIAAAYSTCAALLLFRCRETLTASGPERPAVSILKPLCGAEPRLLDCLRSFARQDYPHMQIVFGVREAADRSEEHTSELQSPMYLVCRLL